MYVYVYIYIYIVAAVTADWFLSHWLINWLHIHPIDIWLAAPAWQRCCVSKKVRMDKGSHKGYVYLQVEYDKN